MEEVVSIDTQQGVTLFGRTRDVALPNGQRSRERSRGIFDVVATKHRRHHAVRSTSPGVTYIATDWNQLDDDDDDDGDDVGDTRSMVDFVVDEQYATSEQTGAPRYGRRNSDATPPFPVGRRPDRFDQPCFNCLSDTKTVSSIVAAEVGLNVETHAINSQENANGAYERLLFSTDDDVIMSPRTSSPKPGMQLKQFKNAQSEPEKVEATTAAFNIGNDRYCSTKADVATAQCPPSTSATPAGGGQCSTLGDACVADNHEILKLEKNNVVDEHEATNYATKAGGKRRGDSNLLKTMNRFIDYFGSCRFRNRAEGDREVAKNVGFDGREKVETAAIAGTVPAMTEEYISKPINNDGVAGALTGKAVRLRGRSHSASFERHVAGSSSQTAAAAAAAKNVRTSRSYEPVVRPVPNVNKKSGSSSPSHRQRQRSSRCFGVGENDGDDGSRYYDNGFVDQKHVNRGIPANKPLKNGSHETGDDVIDSRKLSTVIPGVTVRIFNRQMTSRCRGLNETGARSKVAKNSIITSDTECQHKDARRRATNSDQHTDSRRSDKRDYRQVYYSTTGSASSAEEVAAAAAALQAVMSRSAMNVERWLEYNERVMQMETSTTGPSAAAGQDRRRHHNGHHHQHRQDCHQHQHQHQQHYHHQQQLQQLVVGRHRCGTMTTENSFIAVSSTDGNDRCRQHQRTFNNGQLDAIQTKRRPLSNGRRRNPPPVATHNRIPRSSRTRTSSTPSAAAVPPPSSPSVTAADRTRATPASTIASRSMTPSPAKRFDDAQTPLTGGGSKLGTSLLQFVADVIESLENAALRNGSDRSEFNSADESAQPEIGRFSFGLGRDPSKDQVLSSSPNFRPTAIEACRHLEESASNAVSSDVAGHLMPRRSSTPLSPPFDFESVEYREDRSSGRRQGVTDDVDETGLHENCSKTKTSMTSDSDSAVVMMTYSPVVAKRREGRQHLELPESSASGKRSNGHCNNKPTYSGGLLQKTSSAALSLATASEGCDDCTTTQRHDTSHEFNSVTKPEGKLSISVQRDDDDRHGRVREERAETWTTETSEMPPLRLHASAAIDQLQTTVRDDVILRGQGSETSNNVAVTSISSHFNSDGVTLRRGERRIDFDMQSTTDPTEFLQEEMDRLKTELYNERYKHQLSETEGNYN